MLLACKVMFSYSEAKDVNCLLANEQVWYVVVTLHFSINAPEHMNEALISPK